VIFKNKIIAQYTIYR